MAKRAIRLYAPEEVDELAPLPNPVRTGELAEAALACVLAHAKDNLALSEHERRQLQAEWVNSSVVVFVAQ